MKKILTYMSVLTIVFSLTACKKDEKEKTWEKEREKIEAKNEQKKEVIKQIGGLLLETKATPEGDKLKIDVRFENTTNEAIPLNYKQDLFKVTVIDETGLAIEDFSITDGERKVIQPKEEINVQKIIDFKNKFGNFDVETKLELMDTENIEYDVNELINKIQFTIEKKTEEIEARYLPTEPQTYIYKTDLGGTVIENYQFFDGNYIQSSNSTSGVKVYELSKDGLYLLYENEKTMDRNIIADVKNTNQQEKRLLIPSPLTEGFVWNEDGDAFKIISTKEKVQIGKTIYKDVVKIEKNAQYNYYYDKNIGLLKVEGEYEDGLKTILELKEIK